MLWCIKMEQWRWRISMESRTTRPSAPSCKSLGHSSWLTSFHDECWWRFFNYIKKHGSRWGIALFCWLIRVAQGLTNNRNIFQAGQHYEHWEVALSKLIQQILSENIMRWVRVSNHNLFWGCGQYMTSNSALRTLPHGSMVGKCIWPKLLALKHRMA